ncbi:VWA domain-containing protein, partial [Streptomyces sp. ventii]
MRDGGAAGAVGNGRAGVWRVAVGLGALLLLAPTAGAAHAAPTERLLPAQQADGTAGSGDATGLLMVLDASGSMAEDDGSGGTRMEAAREALSTAVDALPDGHPTGLRLFGSESSSCTDTTLVHPVQPLDRDALREALGDTGPTGNTPTGLALESAADDLPDTPAGALGRRTILLVSDGESNCDGPPPCEVAAELVGNGVGLRIDTVGFRIGEEGRAELECIAEAGHGTYYDAPDGEALGRELERAARLSADGYRFEGDAAEGGADPDAAPLLEPGQYLDTIGPDETRWYAVELDAASAADLSVTAVPHPGVTVDRRDGLALRLEDTAESPRRCDSADVAFGNDEGAMVLTQSVGRIPSPAGGSACDEAGRYALSVTRSSESDSDTAHWPVELRFAVEEPLAAEVRPAASATDYGAAGAAAELPTAGPEDVTGGTGFNDAAELGPGAWRDQLLPAQTRWFKVPVGWGQQLRYRVEFGNEPTQQSGSASSYVSTAAYAPHRAPIGRGGFTVDRAYRGEPLAVELGTVPVTWTNRYESAAAASPVRIGGDYYIAVSLGPEAVAVARNAAIGVVLRVDVLGEELSGPEHGAPPLAGGDGRDASADADASGAGPDDDSVTAADSAEGDGAGWTAPLLAALSGAAGVLLVAAAVVGTSRLRQRGGPGGGAAGGAVAGPL